MLFGTLGILKLQRVRSYDLFLLICLSLNFHAAEATDVVSDFSFQLFRISSVSVLLNSSVRNKCEQQEGTNDEDLSIQ